MPQSAETRAVDEVDKRPWVRRDLCDPAAITYCQHLLTGRATRLAPVGSDLNGLQASAGEDLLEPGERRGGTWDEARS